MNTAISELESPTMRAELIVLVCVLALVLMLEFLLRNMQEDLSENVKHISEISEIAKSFSDSRDFRILFLGNSLTYDGVNTEIFRQEIERRGFDNVSIAKVTPDSTSLWEWEFIYTKHFKDPDVRPDLLIVGFTTGHVVDEDRPDPSRLAAYFCDIGDLPKLYRLGLRDSESLLEFVAADTSRLFSARKLVRSRILDIFVPNYRTVAQHINSVAGSRRPQEAEVPAANSFERLADFIGGAAMENSATVFVAMPIAQAYELDSKIAREIDAGNAYLLDLRSAQGIEQHMFKDVMHLDAEGSGVFSRLLANEIGRNENLRQIFERGENAN